ncbi:hypothetical protein DFH11DRAFT_1731502 [Phellopilus nigrolimitatus]|nr:hypothetical protein DFH11DRAFT_1731502 [Phellopilus nigrolimitatus]
MKDELGLRNFYGRVCALRGVNPHGGTAPTEEHEKPQLKKGLTSILEGTGSEKCKLNNPEEGTMSHAIFVRMLWEYLMEVNALDDEVLQEKLRHEHFEVSQEMLVEMAHMKYIQELCHTGDREQVVKVLKLHVKWICKDDEAQLILFTALGLIEYQHQAHGKGARGVGQVARRRAVRVPAGLVYVTIPARPACAALLHAHAERVPRQSPRLAHAARARAKRTQPSPPLVALLENTSQFDQIESRPMRDLVERGVILRREKEECAVARLSLRSHAARVRERPFCAVALEDGELHVYLPTRRWIMPTFALSAPAAFLNAAKNFLMAVTTAGQPLPHTGTSLLPLLASLLAFTPPSPNNPLGSAPTVLSVSVRPNDAALAHLSKGAALGYDAPLQR